MKKITIALIWIVVALAASRCCNTYLTDTLAVLELLKANGRTWIVDRVTVNETDVTNELFPGMTINFTDTEYTTTNGGDVWAPSGTWNFADDSGARMRRLVKDSFPGVDPIEVVVTENQLTLSFRYPFNTVAPGGRGSSIDNALYVFIFKLV